MADNSKRYLIAILRWLLVAFVIFVVTLLAGAFINFKVLPKIYTASALIQITPLPGGIAGGPLATSFEPTLFQADMEIMQSPDVLLPVIKKLNLDQTWAKRMNKPQMDALPYLRQSLSLDLKRGTNIIEINASSEVPQEAADIANALATQYKVLRDFQEDQRNQRGVDALQAQIDQQQKVIEEKKINLDKMRADLGEKGIEIAPGEGVQGGADLEILEKDLLAAQEDYAARRVLLEKLANLPDDQFIAALNGDGRDPVPAADPAHPLDHDQIEGVRVALKVDTNRAKSRVDLLQKSVDALKNAKLEEIPPALVPYRAAQRDLQGQQSLVNALNVRLKQIVADNQLQQSPVRIISRAEVPTYPSQPNSKLNLVLSVFVGFFLGIFIASLVEVVLWFRR